jgi:hypothetical protein
MKARTTSALLLGVALVGSLLVILVVVQASSADLARDPPSLDDAASPWDRGRGLRANVADRPDDSPIGNTQINSSTLEYVIPAELRPFVPLDTCFVVTVQSPDLDYMDRFEVDLPDAWAINTVQAQPATGCSVSTIAGVDTGGLVYWQTDSTLPSGCGAWNNGDYLFCANITIPDCAGEPWSLPWLIVGDGFGAPPHQVSGTTEPLSCPSSGPSLWPPAYFALGCHSVTQSFTLNLWNHTDVTETFALSYDVPSGNATLTGPDQIYLGQEVDQDLLVDLTPRACLPAGERITGTVTVQGAGYSDASIIAMDIVQESGCPVCPAVYLPVVLGDGS